LKIHRNFTKSANRNVLQDHHPEMFVSPEIRKRIGDRLRRIFGGPDCAIQAAALPWRTSEAGLEVMLVTSRGTGRWVLPKGWPKRREFLHEAAAREAVEEAGLRGSVSPNEAGRYYYDKVRETGERRCEVYVFPIKVEQVEAEWPEKGQRDRRWMSVGEAAAAVAEPDLAQLIAGFGGKRAA
jgi:8-oxo-dGTP pyrophosphatase MutT (NUDIX family)